MRDFKTVIANQFDVFFKAKVYMRDVFRRN